MENNGVTEHNLDVSGKTTENQEENNTNLRTETIESETSKTNVFDFSKPEEVEKPKETDAKEKAETETEKKEIEKEPVKDESKKETDDKKPVFKLKTETPKNTDKPNSEKDNKETKSISNEDVLRYLRDEAQLDVSNIQELSKKQVLPEQVTEFNKFVSETGRGFQAFYNAKKDWSKESEDNTLKEYYKYKNPNLSDEDIQTKIDLRNLSEEEEDEMTSREKRSHNLEKNKEYSEALAFMQKISQDYGKPIDEVKPERRKPTDEEVAEAYRPYWNRRNASLDKFKEIELPIDGLGDIKIPVTQEMKDLISKRTQTQETFFADWMEKDGQGKDVVNTDKSVSDVSWSIPEVRNYLIEEILSQSYTMFMEQYSKENRNVTIDKPKDVKSVSNETMTVEKIGGNNNDSTSTLGRMGEPILK